MLLKRSQMSAADRVPVGDTAQDQAGDPPISAGHAAPEHHTVLVAVSGVIPSAPDGGQVVHNEGMCIL